MLFCVSAYVYSSHKGFTRPILIQALLLLLFGETFDPAGGGGGGDEAASKKKKKQKPKPPAFSHLSRVGLIEFNGKVTVDLAKWVVERSLQRGFTEVRCAVQCLWLHGVSSDASTVTEHKHKRVSIHAPTPSTDRLQLKRLERRQRHQHH